MEVKFLKKVNNGSRIRADFSLVWEKRLIIHHCVLLEAVTGKLYIKFPSRTYMDKGVKIYEPIVEVDNDLLQKISELAVHEFEALK
ncbi:MAG: hypothetical protein WC749_01890 [Dehalococcoidia bacterium]